MPQALKSCPNCNKSPNLVTLVPAYVQRKMVLPSNIGKKVFFLLDSNRFKNNLIQFCLAALQINL